MAEKGQTSVNNSFKMLFDDQLICSVCLDQYTNPKALPCHHSFCLKCIQQLPVEIKDEKNYITCPSCRDDHLLAQAGAENFPSAFIINSLLDLRKKMIITATDRCPQHNDPLKVFCETCSQVVCRDCTMSQQHKTHDYYLISECYSRHHQQIMATLGLLTHKMDELNIAVTNLDNMEKEVLQQGQNLEEQINTHAQQLIQQIQTSQTHLLHQLDTIVHQKTQAISTQKKGAQKKHTELNTCQKMIEHSLKECTQQQILTNKHTLIDQMNTATQQVDTTMFEPSDSSDTMFKKRTAFKTTHIGQIIEANVTVTPCLAWKPSTATLTIQSQDSPYSFSDPSSISSQLSSPDNEHFEKCNIIETDTGKYNITFTSFTRHDQLRVQIGGVDIPHSPYTLPVIPTPQMRGKPVNTITGLNKPWGIAVCDNGDIVVAEHGAHCITVLNKEGKKMRSFGSEGTKDGQFTHPSGVAISTDGHFLVTDDHRLQKLTTAGVCVKSVGSGNNGNGQLQFNCPIGIRVNPAMEEMYVADEINNRIQVVTSGLTFSRFITGSATGIFSQPIKNPYDVALDNDGYLYVAEFCNNCITKLTENGMISKRFGSEGSDPGQLSCPSSLTIKNNLVYVSELGNNRVSIFDTNGTFLHCFGEQGNEEGEFNTPFGITMDIFGNLYISDTNNDRIVVF